MKLSIIIVNYNTKELLKKCLESIYESYGSYRTHETDGKKDWEVIVVDNGSRDGSMNWLKAQGSQPHRRVAEEATRLKAKLKIIENKENVGFGRANNQAIKEAKGDFFLLLNPDTIVSSETISYMLHFMEEHKNVGVATCKVELPNGELDDASHRGFPTPWNSLCHFSGLGKLFPQSLFFNGYHLGYRRMDETHEIDACCGAFMMIRREAGEDIAWFDEDYFWYGEDLDFCYRVKQAGWKIMYVSGVKIIHYKGVASGIKKQSQGISTADEKTRRLAQKARFEAMRIFYKKHYKKKYPAFVGRLVMSGINILSNSRFNLIICA